ncbi:MAG: UDP-2,3-diacylglucosamine diphosphatase [Planctomycetota bacterium]
MSDTHLGCRYARAEALLEFLNSVEPDHLYLVGDIIDGWRLRKSWFWDDVYTAIVRRILELLDRGTQVYYTPGNHDEFLRQFVRDLGQVSLSDEFIHVTADGRRLLVIHGDQFDTVVRHARWLSLVGDAGYNFLLWVNGAFNACRRRLGFGYWSLSAYIKHKVKQATSAIARFEDAVIRHARDLQCDGVVCGHIHTPTIHEHQGLMYYNTGDWVESCTALVEQSDGELRLIRWSGDRHRSTRGSRRSIVAPPVRDAQPLMVETAWRNHGEDLLQPVGGGTRTRHASESDGGGLAEPA